MNTLILAVQRSSEWKIIIPLLCFFLAALGILFILREVRTWYWKINDIVNQQKIQTEILEEILDELKKKSTP